MDFHNKGYNSSSTLSFFTPFTFFVMFFEIRLFLEVFNEATSFAIISLQSLLILSYSLFMKALLQFNRNNQFFVSFASFRAI